MSSLPEDAAPAAAPGAGNDGGPGGGPGGPTNVGRLPRPDAQSVVFSVFLQLERQARHAQSADSLRFVLVNETRRLLPYRQAIFATGSEGGGFRVESVSGVAVPDRSAPYLRWLERVFAWCGRNGRLAEAGRLAPEDLPAAERDEWQEWSAPEALLCPFKAPDGAVVGLLWLVRDQPWADGERVLAEQLADAYAHAWLAKAGRGRLRRSSHRLRWLALVVPLLLLGALAIPVPQSVLAPAEVVPHEPTVVAAPLDGVVESFSVQPNEAVAAGAPLFRLDDTKLRSERDVAARSLEVAEAELRRARQGAFTDRESSAQVALMEARVRLRQAELANAEARLARVAVTAPSAGVAVFGDPNDWIGRPVQTGERILQIADPDSVELRIDLPVDSAIALPDGAEVELFLDADPLRPLAATLVRASYEAEPSSRNSLAYRLIARFDPEAAGWAAPRIGLHGTAKVFGRTVPLALYLFRRPISSLRQTLGF
ncbi:Biotin-lipoyl like [Tistlia consotensis]|uniref:Biotin-lipoyl like n=1 Tax=Tistlia consotensis USBA 355 TaxID=560819 RepID=A0A1Y6CKC4_9PROT|nr:HlyD family efflux transporter periplasmic adaptor subunit [Tistlia consotensis]SMF72540.1 Biotin-lipoyl like [Tistlia consotensis USBA 355]SNS09329.1 Biotin-lipoyl like [Tistlia consotensis]